MKKLKDIFIVIGEMGESASLAKWSSLDLLTEDDDAVSPTYSHDKIGKISNPFLAANLINIFPR